MALFKISKGSKANLPGTLTEGYCWYTYDDSKFYIDHKDESGVLVRKALNAQDAETLTGASLATILTSSDIEIPTSAAVFTALASKSDVGHDHTVSDITDITVTATELNYTSGLTGNIQEQFNSLVPIFIGTQEQYDAKADEILVGTLVIIIDEAVVSGDATSPVLDTGVLGYLILA